MCFYHNVCSKYDFFFMRRKCQLDCMLMKCFWKLTSNAWYNTCFALSILNDNYYHFTCPRQIFVKSKTNFPKKGYKNLSVNVNDWILKCKHQKRILLCQISRFLKMEWACEGVWGRSFSYNNWMNLRVFSKKIYNMTPTYNQGWMSTQSMSRWAATIVK